MDTTYSGKLKRRPIRFKPWRAASIARSSNSESPSSRQERSCLDLVLAKFQEREESLGVIRRFPSTVAGFQCGLYFRFLAVFLFGLVPSGAPLHLLVSKGSGMCLILKMIAYSLISNQPKSRAKWGKFPKNVATIFPLFLGKNSGNI